jgi:hypothetical protein
MMNVMTSSELLFRADPCESPLLPGLYLTVNGEHWRLHTDVNLDYLEAQIKAAMNAGQSLAIQTDAPVPGGRDARIVISGAALPLVLLWEKPDGVEH